MEEGSCLGGKASWGWAAEKGAAEVTRTCFSFGWLACYILYFIFETVVLYLRFEICHQGYTALYRENQWDRL